MVCNIPGFPILHYFLEFAQIGPLVKSDPQPVLINKVLLEHNHARSFTHPQRLSPAEMTSHDRGHLAHKA